MIYNFLLYYLISILMAFFLSEQCIDNIERSSGCSQIDRIFAVIIVFSWIAGIISIIYFGIGAKLLGCRRKPMQSN